MEPRGQMVRFIAETLRPREADAGFSGRIKAWAQAHREQAARLGIGEITDLDAQTLGGLYPLHPIAALCLPELCVRFAQNDRTLFAFLCGGEPNALPAFLRGREIGGANNGFLPSFGPERLYDYFIASAGGITMGRPGAGRWIEIQNMIHRAAALSEPDQTLLKIIGLLNLIAGPYGFKASAGVTAYAAGGPGPWAQAPEALERLSQKGMLIYREYADEYRLWEGTDVDVRAEIAKEREQLGARPIHEILSKAFPLGPMIAARHAYKTGTLRRFERRWAQETEISGENTPGIPDSADGVKMSLRHNFSIHGAPVR